MFNSSPNRTIGRIRHCPAEKRNLTVRQTDFHLPSPNRSKCRVPVAPIPTFRTANSGGAGALKNRRIPVVRTAPPFV